MRSLPINATLNGLSRALDRARLSLDQAEEHRAASFFDAGRVRDVDASFSSCYLTRVYLTGTHRYPGDGWMKALYLAILLTSHGAGRRHGAARPPLPLSGPQGRFPEHRRIARYSLPVWLYVSVTGVVVYVMLYQLA